MFFNIKSTIDKEQINSLKELDGEKLINLYIEDAGEFALNVVLETDNEKLLISNKTITASHDDDYPHFVIQKISYVDEVYTAKEVNKVINSVHIIRDNSTWHNNDHHWDITCDAVIKLTLENEFIYFVAYDSIAGFIKLESVNDETKEDFLLKDYWTMKTEILDSQNRIII